MQKKLKETKGITLVALIITVIILLILAGVTISLVIGKNGLIAKSKESVEKYKEKEKEEQWQLEDFEAGMEEINLAELKDEEEHPELKQMKLVLNITEDNKEIKLPVYTSSDDYKYDCTVNWGDGTTEQVTNENAKTTKHTYGNTGEYTLVIEGTYERLYYNDKSIQRALKKVEQWGATGLKNVYLYDCTNLEEIAEPSKNSFANVTNFNWTFALCNNLANLPEKLFANCPNVTSFDTTFLGCSNIINIPERLFSNCSNVSNFHSTFLGCNNITNIPERIFANCPNVTDFSGTFSECSSVTNIPERIFANCANVTDFSGTFNKCSNITNIPERIFANCANVTDFSSTFYECSSLTSIPEKLFANCPNVTNFGWTFSGCSSLASIPERIFANCPNVTSFEWAFSGCSSLTSIPEKLFANCPNVTNFECTFIACTELTGKSIQLWNEETRQENGITENSGGEACYFMCEKLEDYSQIPSYWKKNPPEQPPQ